MLVTRAASSPPRSSTTKAGVSIVKRSEPAFKIVGLNWIVERAFGWLGRHRRLSKDYEFNVQTSETLVEIAAIRLMLNRLAPA
jgi:transposase